MDIDKELIRSVLRGGPDAYLYCVQRDLRPDVHLFGDGKKAWSFIVDTWQEHGELPPISAVSGALGIDLDGGEEGGHAFWLDEVFKRQLFRVQEEGIERVTKSLEQRDPQAAAEIWAEVHRKIQTETISMRKVESLLALGHDVIQEYEDAKAGKRGIPTPWPSMDDQTLGWWPEDLILFVGRLGVGKTWTLVICAQKAWVSGHKVLFISTEMNKKQVARRFFALHLGLPYNEIRRGKLGQFVEDEKFYPGIKALLKEKGIDIIGGDFDYSIDNVAAVVEDEKPELLCVDGSYLIKNSGKDKHERVSNNFDDFKRIGKRTGIATIANLQFNRSAKTGQEQTISAENIGITDVAGWNADGAFGMLQSEEMRANLRLKLKALKIREGIPQTIEINWNHSAMDFSEVGVEGGGVRVVPGCHVEVGVEGGPGTAPPPGPDTGFGGGGGDAQYATDDDYDDVPF